MRALCAAGDDLVARLRILHRLQAQAKERGDSTVELHVEELCEPADLAAIQRWESAKAGALGHQPLPFEAMGVPA